MDYLYTLQLLREGSPEIVNTILLGISEFVTLGGIFIASFIYWCRDKRWGAFIMASFSGGYMLNQVFKNTACVFRPWISDPRLSVAEAAASSATGYSFPSGHALSATAIYGGTAVYGKRHKGLVAAMIILIILTGFARNWLGAHTLMDVAFAIMEGICVLIINLYFIKLIARHDAAEGRETGLGKTRLILLILGILFVVGSMIYLVNKDYPMDVDANGQLLADPYEMLTDCFTGAGMFLGFLLGWAFEKTFVNFRVEGNKKQLAVRFLGGFFSLAVIYLAVLPFLLSSLDEHTEHIIKYFVVFFYATGLYPLFIKLVQDRRKA
ncbi:MAG: phosphatase PAP2 family protein [Clostridia bacterium]|nr:phosphatase PAP2 family protein [Clostridia bacterium]